MPSMMRIRLGLKGSSKKSCSCGISPNRPSRRSLGAREPSYLSDRPRTASLSHNAELAKQSVATGWMTKLG